MKDDINTPQPLSFALQGSILWPGDCHWGEHAVQRAIQAAGARLKRPLIVTDASVWQALTPVVTLEMSHLDSKLFSEVQPNPKLKQIHDALQVVHQAGCDSVIAIGGGSVIDVAKVVVACMASDMTVEAMQTVQGQAWLDAPQEVSDPMFIAIPTTSGTGSESSSAALIQSEDGRKRVFRSLRTRPKIVALQPNLTLSLPLRPSAQGGFDAILHALGAWVNNDPSPIGKAVALQALRLCLQAFPRVLKTPDSIDARADMQMGSYLAGVAIGMCKVDAVHGMCTPLESKVHMAHAEVLAPIFSVVARYTALTHPERFAQAASALGISETGDNARDALCLIELVEEMASRGGIATSFTNLALTDDDAVQLSAQALQSASTPLNPRPLSPEEIKGLYLQLVTQGTQHERC